MRDFSDTAPLTLEHLPSVLDALRAFKRHIRDYRATLNNEGIWLFLATVGCWGVTDLKYQLAAYVLTGFLFASRVNERLTERKSFSNLSLALGDRVRNELTDPEQRTRLLLELELTTKSNLQGWRPFWGTRVFLACWAFFGASVFHALPF